MHKLFGEGGKNRAHFTSAPAWPQGGVPRDIEAAREVFSKPKNMLRFLKEFGWHKQDPELTTCKIRAMMSSYGNQPATQFHT